MTMDNPTNVPTDSLTAFLKEEIDDIRIRLGVLKGKMKKEEFDSLERELNEKSIALEFIQDGDDPHLFILRREINALKESIESHAVKRRWWSRFPTAFWVAIIALPVILYFVWLSVLQWRGTNQGLIYDYPATQTAVAAQTTMPAATETPTPTPTQIP